MAQRRGLPCDLFQVPGVMPLLVIGSGPILMCAYLDDHAPIDQSAEGAVGEASVSGDAASGPGVTRAAGLLTSLGALFSGGLSTDDVTLLVEADRHLGSLAMQSWLSNTSAEFDHAFWEATDAPVRTPALYTSATGVITARVTVESGAQEVESFYAGVLPDVGHQLALALASLKSRDAEVLVDGFYDHIETPDTAALDRLNAIAEDVRAWVSRGSAPAADERLLSASHVTLGLFCAPSIMVRSIEMSDASPYAPRSASAVVEARLMPGQDAHAVFRSLTESLTAQTPGATVEPALIRQPYSGKRRGGHHSVPGFVAYPTAPGNSPAGLLAVHGISSMGFATVSRSATGAAERAHISDIEAASALIADLVCGALNDAGRVD